MTVLTPRLRSRIPFHVPMSAVYNPVEAAIQQQEGVHGSTPTMKRLAVAYRGRVALALLAVAVLAAIGGIARSTVFAQTGSTFADAAFERVWGRTDALVLNGQVARSWYWGPQPGVAAIEIYDEGVN